MIYALVEAPARRAKNGRRPRRNPPRGLGTLSRALSPLLYLSTFLPARAHAAAFNWPNCLAATQSNSNTSGNV